MVKYDSEARWRAEDDLRTLKRAEEIKKDPERVRNVKQFLQEERQFTRSIMGIPTPPPTPSRRNPATIMQMADPFAKR